MRPRSKSSSMPCRRRPRARSSAARSWSAPGSPRGPSLPAAAKLPVRWKIVAAHEVIAEGEAADRVIAWPPDLPLGVHRLQLTDAASATEDVPLIVGAGKRLWRGFRPLLAARGPALQRPLGAQLGDRRFHRPRRPDRTRPPSRRRRRRPQSAACAVRRSPRRLQSLFAEQPAVSQCALYRSSRIFRNFASTPGRGMRWRR